VSICTVFMSYLELSVAYRLISVCSVMLGFFGSINFIISNIIYSTVVFASNPALCDREDVMRSLSRAFDGAAYIVPATTSYRSKTAGLYKPNQEWY